jgi:hypothetical protein
MSFLALTAWYPLLLPHVHPTCLLFWVLSPNLGFFLSSHNPCVLPTHLGSSISLAGDSIRTVDFSFESPEPSKISGRKKAFNIHLLNE